MSNQSYKELLIQARKLEAEIRQHQIIMVRRAVAGLHVNTALHAEVRPKLEKLDSELGRIIRDYDLIDVIIDNLMFKLGVEA